MKETAARPARAALRVFLAGAVLGLLFPLTALAHHTQTTWVHWANFPTTITVYNCSGDRPTLQTAINSWNSNGGLGTIFTLASGTNCNPSSGIKITSVSCVQAGCYSDGAYTTRPREIAKELPQLGRVFREGIAGKLRETKAQIDINPLYKTDVGTYAHELGHAVGLADQYDDVGSVGVCAPWVSVMVCSPSGFTGPQARDSSAAIVRYLSAPWGSGAVWISSDDGANVTIQWADLNDNETGYDVYKDGIWQGTWGIDTQLAGLYVSSGEHSFFVRAKRGALYNQSSTIYRYAQPGNPSPVSSVSVLSGSESFNFVASWTSNDASYTHEWGNVWRSSQLIASFYVPAHGTGYYSTTLNLLNGDLTSGSQSYLVEVYTCNQNHNPWYVGCTYGGGGNVSLSW